MAKIVVSSSQVSDPTKPNVSSFFYHDIPEASETKTHEDCLNDMVTRFGHEAIYELVKGAYTIAIQAPARKELLAQWENISAAERASLIVAPINPEGQFTAELPLDKQALLQARMDVWKLGEKAPRGVRTVIVQGDPIKAIMEGIADGSLTGDRLEEMRTKVAELLGLQSARRR